LAPGQLSLAGLLVGLAALALPGCSGPPVPMRAVAGTTFALAIGPDEPNAGGGTVGYGTVLFPDPQRGVLGVEFAQGGVVEALVPVKLVTRLMPDPASRAGLTGSIETPSPFGSFGLLGQVAAVIDLPHTLPEGPYDLTIRRYTDATLTALIDQGPYESAQWKDDLYVEAGDGSPHHTPFSGGWGIANYALGASHVQQIVPYPQLLLSLPSGTAAATLDIGFPDAKIDIEGAYFYRLTGHSALVEVQAVDTDTIRLHVVDPGAQDHWLALVFENVQGGYAPVLETEFTYEAGAFYDADGAPIDPGSGYDPIAEIR
jgi:hypothetical protein